MSAAKRFASAHPLRRTSDALKRHGETKPSKDGGRNPGRVLNTDSFLMFCLLALRRSLLAVGIVPAPRWRQQVISVSEASRCNLTN